MLIYQAARVHRGRASTEFTYDLHDYPENDNTLASAWRLIGERMRQLLAGVEQRLNDAGMPQTRSWPFATGPSGSSNCWRTNRRSSMP